jgi:hypothetical protein
MHGVDLLDGLVTHSFIIPHHGRETDLVDVDIWVTIDPLRYRAVCPVTRVGGGKEDEVHHGPHRLRSRSKTPDFNGRSGKRNESGHKTADPDAAGIDDDIPTIDRITGLGKYLFKEIDLFDSLVP